MYEDNKNQFCCQASSVLVSFMVREQVKDRVVSRTTKDGSYPVVSPMGSVAESITSECDGAAHEVGAV